VIEHHYRETVAGAAAVIAKFAGLLEVDPWTYDGPAIFDGDEEGVHHG